MKKIFPLCLLVCTTVLILACSVYAGKIHLKSTTIDTKAANGETVVSLERAHGAGYYIVCLKGVVKSEDKLALTDAGAEIIEYVPDYSFVVRVEHSNVKGIRKLNCVEWVGPYKAEYKWVDNLLKGKAPVDYIVRLFPGHDPEFVMGKGKALGVRKIDCKQRKSGALCHVMANRSQIIELAKLSAVAWIEPYVQPELCNSAASTICGVPELRDDLGLYGADQIIGIADSGLDTGNFATLATDFAGRIRQIDTSFVENRNGEWSDLNGHGTHVIGALLGSGVQSGSDPAAHNYTGSFAGVAPEAELALQCVVDAQSRVRIPLYLEDLFGPAYASGARVHSDSWGNPVEGEYTQYSSEVDQFIWSHKDFSIVFAVGNEGKDRNQDGIIDSDNLYAPATAKNCISVGASENNCSLGGYQQGYGTAWPTDYPVAPIKFDFMSNNIDGIAAFSSRGPTDDGRIKPDICAPGTNVISNRTHTGIIGKWWGTYDSNYVYWGGTSISTPHVAGAAALVREYFQKEKGINPSAALVKATLINGAVDIAPGQYGTGQRQEVMPAPDKSQGWGRLNVKQSISPTLPLVNEFADESATLSTGAYRDYQYTVINNSLPFKATLVWTDYPGALLAAKELVNDLDLTVTSPTGTVYPTGGLHDRVNNVEQVEIAAPELGTYSIRVTGFNIPMESQDYALVVTGGLPSTYISGSVTSASGAGVPGALMTLVSGGVTKRVTTNQDGNYLTHVAPGTYSIQISKSGWTFTPRARSVVVTDSPVTNVNFLGQGTPGSVNGHVTSSIGGVVSYKVESPHPYLNDFDKTYVITAHESATHMRVHFAEIDLIDDGDTVYVLDANDVIKDTYTWRLEDIWSSWVNGNVIKIRIVSNSYGSVGYGFYVDGYETDLITQGGLAGAKLTLSPGGYETTSIEGGSYSIGSVPPGTYTVTPSKEHWKFQPTLKIIEIPSGGTTSNIDFLAFPPGSISGEIRVSTNESQNVSIHSLHPYTNNYDQTWEVVGNSSATRIRLHFDQLSTEPAFDWVYILDSNDNIIDNFTADYTDLWSPWVPGNVAKIRLLSDEASTAYGFHCDKYEVETLGGGLAGVQVDLSPDNRTVYTTAQGLFSFTNVDVGSHIVTPSLTSWSFDPLFSSVSISAGTLEQLLFYASADGLTTPSQVKRLGDTLQITLSNVTVSAVYKGFFYVQDSAFGGIRVVSSQTVHEGNVVDVTGMLATVNGERRINAASVIVH